MINTIIEIIEIILFLGSLLFLVVWILLSVFNVMEGWELPILVPLLYCVIKLKRISSDNRKIKRALSIDENATESK